MSPRQHRYNNRLLAAFPSADIEQYFVNLTPISLSLRDVLVDAGAPIENVFFVEEGLACILTKMANGSTIEVGMIGYEGMVGVTALLGDTTSAHQIIVQIPGTALRMTASLCKAAFDESATVRAVIHRFMGVVLDQSAQTAACNRLHTMEQRLARWLLTASDRARSDIMPMTHDFLATMLGVRRTGVSEVASALQRSGLIQYRRGRVRITGRAALEATACECYGLDRDRFRQLL
jgi:CRP-like cAMP-binding protein